MYKTKLKIGNRILDLQGNIFKITKYKDLHLGDPFPIFEEKEFPIFTRDLISDDLFTLIRKTNTKYNAIFYLGEAYNKCYLRVSLIREEYIPELDIRKAYENRYSKKIPKTLRNYFDDDTISSIWGQYHNK